MAKRVAGNQLVEAINQSLISSCEKDSKGESANIVDGLFAIAKSIEILANVIKWNQK